MLAIAGMKGIARLINIATCQNIKVTIVAIFYIDGSTVVVK